ncbi:MAG: terminase large subunit [Desulfurellales bacterium]|nr:MAG: terminase large subunit [Desulfurellales bacterium]
MSERIAAADIPDDWRAMLLRVPGYDSIATAEWAMFNPVEAQKALDFFPLMLRHVEGEMAGQPFTLQEWQKGIIANLFGWQRQDSYERWVRRYREALIYIPRKNGKSPLAAGIALYVFFCDRMVGKQCYLAAGDRSQAGVVFSHCKGMVNQEPLLAERCKIYGGTGSEYQTRSIVREDEHSFLRVISADANTKHGGNTLLAVVDELHVQPNRDLVDVLSTSMASKNVPQPLMVYLTTADYERVSICNEKHDYACKVRDGLIQSPTFLPVIYEATLNDDWTKPEVWAKANPNLGVSVSKDYLELKCKEAQELMSFQNTFLRLNLNVRTQQDTRAIPMDDWDACSDGVTDPLAWRNQAMDRLKGRRCAGGLDLGSVSDLTAFVLLFEDEESPDFYDVLPFFWCPRASAEQRSKRQQVPYLAWGQAGFVTLTDGNETDYQIVRRDINQLCDRFGVFEISADRLFQGAQLCQDLIRDGLNVVEMGQGYVSMAAPTRRLLELVIGHKLRHGANPVLRWMAGNAATESDNANGDAVLKFSKRKSTEKIDGIMGLCMALRPLMEATEEVTWYTPGSLSL